MFVLMTQDGGCLGVYTDEQHLSDGVDYWMKERHYIDKTLAYQNWQEDYIYEAFGWEWCYIAPNASVKDLRKGGGTVPQKKWWGKNLVFADWGKDNCSDCGKWRKNKKTGMCAACTKYEADRKAYWVKRRKAESKGYCHTHGTEYALPCKECSFFATLKK